MVSDLCCYYLKEKPCDDYAKESGRFPYMGLMASEGGRRQKALMLNGCNYISKDTKRSAPFAIFTRQDLLTLALEMQEWYHEHWEEFRPILTAMGQTRRDAYGAIRITLAEANTEAEVEYIADQLAAIVKDLRRK